MAEENCGHNILVKYVRPNEDLFYRCMKCGQKFEAPKQALPKERT